ncbi:MAG TPA: GGDEF domain-containing protein [Solirubrobacterales bacterium]|nr:GGDEF domain-containing protein [Solirubrobacterales bacterium]
MRKLVGAVLFGGTAAAILADWVGVDGPGVASAVNGPVYDSVVVAAGLACLLRARESAAERAAWLTIGASVLFWAAAEIYWTLYIEGNSSAPYPSPADVGYLVFYPLAVVGLYLLVRARAKELDPRLWMDGAIAALGTGALGAALIFEFVADRTSGSTLEVATTLAYPLGDIVLLALVVGVVALTRWRPGRTWTLLLAGLAAMAVADVAYTLQTYDTTLPGGNWIEPIYLFSAVFVGGAAWQPQAATIEPDARFDGWRELVVPGIVAVTMIALVGMQYFSHANALTTVLWSATMLAVVARLALSLRANKALLEQVQTDQLTGLGSKARLDIDLEARCLGATEEPLAVMLLDLNGFKRYNDRFGHPAGDELLRQLGGRLRAAAAPEGFAYRTGGDEFVVLVDGASDVGAVTKRAAEALSTRGYGYDISASLGLAEVPGEADGPRSALQLADVRMYAQKESRRLAGPLPLADREAIEQRA